MSTLTTAVTTQAAPSAPAAPAEPTGIDRPTQGTAGAARFHFNQGLSAALVEYERRLEARFIARLGHADTIARHMVRLLDDSPIGAEVEVFAGRCTHAPEIREARREFRHAQEMLEAARVQVTDLLFDAIRRSEA